MNKKNTAGNPFGDHYTKNTSLVETLCIEKLHELEGATLIYWHHYSIDTLLQKTDSVKRVIHNYVYGGKFVIIIRKIHESVSKS